MEFQILKQSHQYSSAEKQQLVQQWKASGLSRQAFCRQHNFNYNTLISWTRKPRKRGEFIPLKITDSPENLFARLDLGKGKSLQFFQAVSASYLKQLL